MFGTLVVCLPSEHHGGDIVLKHRDSTKVFKTSKTQPSMACWFSDVSHEILPVTSGLFIVLTYNLAIVEPPNSTRPSANLNTPTAELVAGVERAVRAWLDSGTRHDASSSESRAAGPEHLYYLLDHNYTRANLSLNKLKGSDLSRIKCLKDVCDSQNATLFLALLEKDEEGACDIIYPGSGRRRGPRGNKKSWHPFIETLEVEYEIKTLVSMEGEIMHEAIAIENDDIKKNLIQYREDYDPFSKAECGEKGYSYTGNEGVTAIHWYRLAVRHLSHLTTTRLTDQVIHHIGCRNCSQQRHRCVPNEEPILHRCAH